MLVRLMLNSQPQIICLPQPPKVLGLQVRAIVPSQKLMFIQKLICKYSQQFYL